MDMFEKAKELILEYYANIGERSHAINTLEWVFKLTETPSEELQLAALSHDIDRLIPPIILQGKDESYTDYKVRHSERSSQLIRDLLTALKLDAHFIERVAELVKCHEIGGEGEFGILQDADSISYFEKNLEGYFERYGLE